MYTFITVWVLTVSHVSNSNKAAFAYQLQYADKKTCMANIRAHSEHYTKPGKIINTGLVNEGKSARCYPSQVVVSKK